MTLKTSELSYVDLERFIENYCIDECPDMDLAIKRIKNADLELRDGRGIPVVDVHIGNDRYEFGLEQTVLDRLIYGSNN